MSDAHPPEIPRLASALERCGLATPATILIEALKPWRFAASQLLLLSEPLWGRERRFQVRRYADWIEEQGVEALLEALRHSSDREERPR